MNELFRKRARTGPGPGFILLLETPESREDDLIELELVPGKRTVRLYRASLYMPRVGAMLIFFSPDAMQCDPDLIAATWYAALAAAWIGPAH